MINTNLILISLVLLFVTIFLEIKNHKYKNSARNVSLLYGIGLLLYASWHIIEESFYEFSSIRFVAVFTSVIITYLLIMYFSHKHTKDTDIKGLVTAEFSHGLVDGAVIGMAYMVNPLFGWGTLLAVISHEIPKVIGTFFLIRSQIGSIKQTIKYSVICILGIPIAAGIIYLMKLKISPEYGEIIEAAAIASLIMIIIRLIYKTFLVNKKQGLNAHNH